jgi:hypothetical protein
MMNVLRLLFTTLLFSISELLSAQGTIRGFVKDSETGQPVIFILVGLEGTAYGTQTDENGYYSLTKIPDGKYKLIIAAFGFKQVSDEVVVVSDKVIPRNYLLEKDDVMLQEVEISDKGSDKKKQRKYFRGIHARKGY